MYAVTKGDLIMLILIVSMIWAAIAGCLVINERAKAKTQVAEAKAACSTQALDIDRLTIKLASCKQDLTRLGGSGYGY